MDHPTPEHSAEKVRNQRLADAAQRSVERFRQTAAELRTQAQGFDELAVEWEKRVAFYSEQIDGDACSCGHRREQHYHHTGDGSVRGCDECRCEQYDGQADV